MSQWISQTEFRVNSMKVYNNQSVVDDIYKKTDTTNTFISTAVLNITVINNNTAESYNKTRSTSNYLMNTEFNFIKYYTVSKLVVDVYLNISGTQSAAPMSMRCIIYNTSNVEQASENVLFYTPWYNTSSVEQAGQSQMTNIKFYFNDNLAAGQYKIRLVPWRTDTTNMVFNINTNGTNYVVAGVTPYSTVAIYEIETGSTITR